MILQEQIIVAIADILAFFGIYAIVSLALNIAYGYSGVPNFGMHMPVLGGAAIVGGLIDRFLFSALSGYFEAQGLDPSQLDYVSNSATIATVLTQYFETNALSGLLAFLSSLLLASAFGALLGYLLSLPAARLREEYLAMATLALAEVFFNILRFQRELIGGTIGLQVVDPLSWMPERYLSYSVLLMAALIAVYAFANRLLNSPLGRAFKAIRDDDVAASTMGYDVAKLRELSMAIAGAVGGLAGALWAFYISGINAIDYNRVYWTFIPWLIVILGGTANNAGVIAGSLAYVAIRRFIILGKDYLNPYLPFDASWLEYLLIGAILIAILIYRPQGIVPERPLRTLSDSDIVRARSGAEPSLSSPYERG